MNKREVQKRVLTNGKPLALNLFTWDEKTKTLSSKEDSLVIDFDGVNGCTFETGSYCTFTTGFDCVFKAGRGCVFSTESRCTFKTEFDCVFKTGGHCTFKTEFDCVFKTGCGCAFETGHGCVVVRTDPHEVIKLKEGQKIKLNGYGVKGFTIVKT